jgi:ferrochelatase
LEPDILDHLDALHEAGVKNLIIHPIGFLSDHMEVMYDLDEEAKHRAEEHGMRMERAATVGVHPTFVAMLAELIQERITPGSIRRAIGKYGPSHDFCPVNCCLPPGRQPAPAIGGQTA